MALSNGPNLGLLVNAAQGEAHFAAQQKLLRGLDALVQPSVKDKDLATPPPTPADGDRYIVAAAPTGAWVGHAGEIARWSSVATAWEFYVPKAGWRMYVEDEAGGYIYTGAIWIPPPSSGLWLQTADHGGFLAVAIHAPIRAGFGAKLDIANRVRVHQFVLPWRETARRVVIDILVAFAAGKAGVALYTADGNTLVASSGVIDTTSIGIQTKTFTELILEAGVYFFAWTGDNTTFEFRNWDSDDVVMSVIRQNGPKIGNAANPSVAGVFPATLGTITPATLNTPGAYWEP